MDSQYPQVKRRASFLWRGEDWNAVQLEEDSPDVSDAYLKLGEGWRVLAPTVGDRCKLAGIGVYDSAVPQAWMDEHRADVALHGGYVVWVYGQGDLLGHPMYADEIDRLAAQTCAARILDETTLEEA